MALRLSIYLHLLVMVAGVFAQTHRALEVSGSGKIYNDLHVDASFSAASDRPGFSFVLLPERDVPVDLWTDQSSEITYRYRWDADRKRLVLRGAEMLADERANRVDLAAARAALGNYRRNLLQAQAAYNAIPDKQSPAGQFVTALVSAAQSAVTSCESQVATVLSTAP